MTGDWVERISDFWCVLLLGACAVLSFLVGLLPTMSPQCWCPAAFTSSAVSYVQVSQLLSDTYYLPYLGQRMWSNSDLHESYHLWIPIILLLQALAFKIPQVLVSLVETLVSPSAILDTSVIRHNLDPTIMTKADVAKRTARLMAELLSKNNIVLTCMTFGKRILLGINLISQLVFLQVLFKSGSHLFRKDSDNKTVDSVLHKGPVLHDFSIRVRDTIQQYTVQCIIPLNAVYDKLFIVLWSLILLVAILSFINTALWVIYILVPRFSRNKVKIFLKSLDQVPSEGELNAFVHSFLGWDGSYILHVLCLNGLQVQAAVLTQQFWVTYQEHQKQSDIPGLTGHMDSKKREATRASSAEQLQMTAFPAAAANTTPTDSLTSAEIHSSKGITE